MTYRAALLLFGIIASCSSKRPAPPSATATAPTPLGAPTGPNCIDEALVSDMFSNSRKGGALAIDGPMLWGYFFVDRDRTRLGKARDALVRQGYRFVKIRDPEQAGDPLMLHVERVETHSIESLNARNRELCALAAASDLQAYDGMDVGPVDPPDLPFMEHPTGQFKTAVDAMADAIKRLRALPVSEKWITFNAQGMGHREDSYHLADIRMRRDEIVFESSPRRGRSGKPVGIDVRLVTKRAGAPESGLSKTAGGYSVAKATPLEAARIMDVIFRKYLGIRPHKDEGDDYAIGAEW